MIAEAPRSGERPANKLLNPTSGLASRLRCSHGWRKSASHNNTCLPCWAKRIARFQLKKLFPSPSKGLVTRSERGGAPLRDNSREVRSERSDSTNRERGLVSAGSGDLSFKLTPLPRAGCSRSYGSTRAASGRVHVISRAGHEFLYPSRPASARLRNQLPIPLRSIPPGKAG